MRLAMPAEQSSKVWSRLNSASVPARALDALAVSCLNGHFANKPLRTPVKTGFALEEANHSLDDPTAKSMMSRRLHRRTIHLGPAMDEFVVGLVRRAPYLVALVASSCNATATACATSGLEPADHL